MTALGYCKACSSPLVKEINKRLKRGDSQDSIAQWCASKDFPITRQKLGDHKKHITDQKQTLVDHAKSHPVIKSGVTDDEFSQAILDISYQRAIENPDEITVNHGIQIVKARAAKKQNTNALVLMFAQASMGRLESAPKPELIEGEYAVVEELPTSG